MSITTTRQQSVPTVRGPMRTAAAAGVVWLVAGLGSFTPAAPEVGTAEAIREYAAANGTTLTVNALSAFVSVLAVLVLTSALAELVAARRPVAARFIAAAGVVTAVQMLVFTSIHSVWLLVDPAGLTDGAIETLHHLTPVAATLGAATLPVTLAMVAVVSWLGLRDGFLSRPVALLGLIIAAAEVVSLASLAASNPVSDTGMYVAIFGWFCWPLMIAVDFIVRLVRT